MIGYSTCRAIIEKQSVSITLDDQSICAPFAAESMCMCIEYTD